jgi:Na+-transporting methylmalonyl-CoA/oxaloacetate decarboxylase gamma subunit
MKIEEAKQQIQELEKLRRQTRHMRLVTILALLAIVITGVSAIINSIYSLTYAGPRQAVFINALSADLRRDLLPVVQKIASRSAERLKPAVEAELQKVNARAPEVANVALRELNQMGNELPADADKILDQTISGMLHEREGKLRQMYPDVYDKQVDVLLDNLALEIEDQLAQTGEKIFNPHLNSIQSILANLDKIQKSEPVADSKDIDSWQVAFMFMDVFVTEFKDLAPPETAQPKAAVSKLVEHENTKISNP